MVACEEENCRESKVNLKNDVARGYRPSERRRIEGDCLNGIACSMYKIERTYNTYMNSEMHRNDDEVHVEMCLYWPH